MRVVLVDPASYTPPYDHALASALVRRGNEVDLVTSRFRFGITPTPDGYRRREMFYPWSSRIPGRSDLRLPLRGLEHLAALPRVSRLPADVVHHQWIAWPQGDVHLLPLPKPSLITAHDILPRRTSQKVDLWRRIYARFDAVVVHSENGRERLVGEVGVDRGRIHVIPHPVFQGTPRDEDDGRTIVSVGSIRPYKQIEHTIEVAERLGARLIAAGDDVMDLSQWANLPWIEWRLGWQEDDALEDVLAQATVAVFPYRQELDQSGALLRALGSGVPVVTYDVGGMAEPVTRFGAGAAVPPNDLDALTEATRRLLADPEALERAKAGARQAAKELTWDASAAAHVELYRTLVD